MALNDHADSQSRKRAGNLISKIARSHVIKLTVYGFNPVLHHIPGKLGIGVHLAAALRTESLALDRLATLRAELRAGRKAGSTARACAHHRLLEFLFGHVRRFLSDLTCLLDGCIGLSRRVFRFEIGGAVQTQTALGIPACVVDPFSAALALFTVPTPTIAAGSCFNPTQLI
jgi:hypothetical protein